MVYNESKEKWNNHFPVGCQLPEGYKAVATSDFVNSHLRASEVTASVSVVAVI